MNRVTTLAALAFVGSLACGGKATTTRPWENAPANDLALLSASADLVGQVDLVGLKASGAYQNMLAPLVLGFVNSNEIYAKIKELCKFDPYESITSAAFSISAVNGSTESPDVALVIHTNKDAELKACVNQWKGKAAEEGVTLEEEGGILLANSKDGHSLAVAFPRGAVFARFSGTSKLSAMTMVDALTGKDSLQASAEFQDIYKNIPTSTAWVSVNGASSILSSQAGALGGKPKAMTVSAQAADDVSAQLRIRMADDATAGSLVKTLSSQLTLVKSMINVDKMDLQQAGPDLVLDVKATQAQVQGIISTL